MFLKRKKMMGYGNGDNMGERGGYKVEGTRL